MSDITVVAGQPQVADLFEPPALVRLRVIDQYVTAAQHVLQLGHLHAVPHQVDDDRRLLQAEMRGSGQQPLA